MATSLRSSQPARQSSRGAPNVQVAHCVGQGEEPPPSAAVTPGPPRSCAAVQPGRPKRTMSSNARAGMSVRAAALAPASRCAALAACVQEPARDRAAACTAAARGATSPWSCGSAPRARRHDGDGFGRGGRAPAVPAGSCCAQARTGSGGYFGRPGASQRKNVDPRALSTRRQRAQRAQRPGSTALTRALRPRARAARRSAPRAREAAGRARAAAARRWSRRCGAGRSACAPSRASAACPPAWPRGP